MEVKLSRHYRDKADTVSYDCVGKDGRIHEHRHAACYHAIIAHLGVWEITCRPWRGNNSAPPLTFQRFFRELVKCGLVPKGVEILTRNGKNIIVIPRRGWSYHTVFIILSLYRHADTHGKSILGRTMRLYDQHHKAGTHFLQCLHWALVNTSHGGWHSCFSLSSGPYGSTEAKNRNLKHGLGIAAFGQLTLTEKNALSGSSSSHMFDRLSREFRDIKVSGPDKILDPKYAKYYKDPNLARK